MHQDDKDDVDEDEDDMHALALACTSGDLQMVHELIGKRTPLDFFFDDVTPLRLAVEGGHAGCVRALLQAGARCIDTFYADNDSTLYENALWNGRLEVVMALTEFGVPRWGRSMSHCHLETFYGMPTAEIEALGFGRPLDPSSMPSAERQQQIHEFLVATRKFNARAGDPNVYIGLQVLEMTKLQWA